MKNTGINSVLQNKCSSFRSHRLFSYPPKANNLKSNHLIRVGVQSSVSKGQRGRTQTAFTRVLWKQRPTWRKLGMKAVRCSNIYRIRLQTEWDKKETPHKTKDPKISEATREFEPWGEECSATEAVPAHRPPAVRSGAPLPADILNQKHQTFTTFAPHLFGNKWPLTL